MEEGSHRFFEDGRIGCCHDLGSRNEAGESAAGNLALLGGWGPYSKRKEQF
jgi:hypothetical protein